MTESNPYRSAADRAREGRRQFPLRNDTWSASMQVAREARRARTAAAARVTIEAAGQLAAGEKLAENMPPDPMWSVRGEPRSREHFADPHPGDFPGGLPLPPETPGNS